MFKRKRRNEVENIYIKKRKPARGPLDETATLGGPIMGDPQWGAIGETRAMEAYKGRQGPIIIYMHAKTH